MRSFSQAVGAEYFAQGVLVQVPERGGGAHKGRDLSGSSEGEGLWRRGRGLETAEAPGLGQGRAEKRGGSKQTGGATSLATGSCRGRGRGLFWAGPL